MFLVTVLFETKSERIDNSYYLEYVSIKYNWKPYLKRYLIGSIKTLLTLPRYKDVVNIEINCKKIYDDSIKHCWNVDILNTKNGLMITKRVTRNIEKVLEVSI